MSQTDGQTDRQTDGQTDRQTEIAILKAAWSQLKILHSQWTPLENTMIITFSSETELYAKRWKYAFATPSTFTAMHSPDHALKPQIWPVSLSPSGSKRRKLNRPWPKSNQFWRWSGYISMQNFRAFLPYIFWEMLRYPSRQTGRQTDGQMGWAGWWADILTDKSAQDWSEGLADNLEI